MLLGFIGVLILILLPGAWVTFSFSLNGLSFWIKVVMGIMLAPVVIGIQFYILRIVGISFEQTSILLVFLNLPPLYLILKQWEKFPHIDRKALLAACLVFLIIIIAIGPFLVDPQKRLNTWEAWSQADVIYSIANGSLDLQDAEMVGVRLSYPWLGQVYQAVLSYVSNTPPVTNYIWQNLIWLMCMFGFAAGLTAELGGNQFSQVTTAVWLSFGVNFIGAVVHPLIPVEWVRAHALLGSIWGDNRYTPWLDKVVFFGQMFFAMGIFSAILYLIIRSWAVENKRNYLLVIGLLLTGLGLIYPVLLPAACIVVSAKTLFILFRMRSGWDRYDLGEFLGYILVVLVSSVLTFVYIRFLTQVRTGASIVNLHDLRMIRSRLIETIIVTSPLLAGLFLVFLSQWRRNREKLIILGLGACGSAVLYILFDIPWWRNEYKFIFTAAICLAPFLSLALESTFNRFGKIALLTLSLITVILASPFIYNIYTQTYILYTRPGPLIDVQQFDMRLDDREPLSDLIDAIRQRTPRNSLLIVENAEFNYPTLTRRQLYAPPKQEKPYSGILITSEQMLTLVKGYPSQILEERQNILQDLYNSKDPIMAIQQINKFNRPLALVIDEKKNGTLLDWLERKGSGQFVFRENGIRLYLIGPQGK